MRKQLPTRVVIAEHPTLIITCEWLMEAVIMAY